MCKKLLLYFSLFNILFFSTIYAEIIKYDSSILFIKNEKNWVSPFHFIKTACISKISDNEIILDLGADHGVQTGLIYNIYHDLHKKPEAQICIISADKRTSIGYFLLKPKVIENIIPGDMAIFTGLIETKENLSYQNRMEKILSGKINLIEKDLTFINLKKPDGIETGQTFNVFNEKNDNIGEIEIIEPSNSGDSIAIIKTQKSPFNFGFNIKKGQRTAIEWSNIAHSLTTDKNNPDDIVYAYIKAIKMGINPADISIEVETTISPIAKKFESESNFGKSAYYYNLCKSFNKHCDDNYKFIIEKAMEQSKFFWKNKDWLEVIKILENLPKNEDTEKYLSGSYNFLGKECEEKNHSMAIYCYEQAFKISPTNIFAIKNMINLYFQDIIFDEAISWIKKFKQAALRDDDKNWAEIRQEEIERAKENRSPNYSFTTNYGKNFSMDSLNGNVVLLILWNLSNAPSKQAIENLKFLNENNKNKKFKILAIHSTRDTEAVKRYTQGTEKFEFDIVFADNDIGFLFPSPDNLPQNVILDKRGKIIYQKTGFDENELKNVIDSLLLE